LPDGCFALEPIDVTTEALVREIRRFRPHVMTTYDENGGYPHPDHIMTHTVSMAAFAAAGDPAAYPHAGAPWQPLKIYYNAHSRAKYAAFHEALLAEGKESPYADWLAGWDESKARTVTTRVPCAEYFDRRDQALLAHATQVDPDGAWFHVPRELQQRVWPTEDFEAAVSYVPLTVPEDDLFAGIPDVASGDALATRGGLEAVYDGRVGVAS
jgi:mycothiol S-conjugate amidase